MVATRLLTDTATLESINTSGGAVSPQARQLGWNFKTNATGKIVVAGYVKMNNAGVFAAGTRWQLWKRAAPISASTLIQDIDIGGLTGSAGVEVAVPGVANTALVQNDFYFVTIFHPGSETSNYWFKSGFGNPSNGSLSGNCIFRDSGGTSASTPPDDESFTNGSFAVDIAVDDSTITGTVNLNVPALEFDSAGELTAAGVLNATVPALEFDSAGEVTISGVVDLNLPALEFDSQGQLPVSGVLNLTLPPLTLDLTGASAAGGTIMGPCGWAIPDPVCCTDWAGFSTTIKADAKDYAAVVLWAATGRIFGTCQMTVRPCGMKRCQDGLGEFWGYDWSGGTWTPYIFNGQWFNCACPGVCCCDPRCQVRLMGPVDSVLEVTVGGVVVDPSAYRVDDNHWLVRTDGDCWPICADMDTDDGSNVFTVTYMRGDPTPPALLRAASTLACEWGKACTGGDCRLSPRVSSLVRNGITIDMMDPQAILEGGLTGLWEVDTIIMAFNPYKNHQRLRIYAPELNVPRTVTSP